MKYNKESLPLIFELTLLTNNSYFDSYPNPYIGIWLNDSKNHPIKQMFCYTFDLDYDYDLTDSDIDRIIDSFGEYAGESDRYRLCQPNTHKEMRSELFLLLTNSPKCPYKIIGVTKSENNLGVFLTYHFMLKDNILGKPRIK